MLTFTSEQAVEIRQIMKEAEILMGLEYVARRIDPHKPDTKDLDNFISSASSDISPYHRRLLLRMGRKLKERVDSLNKLDADNAGIFRSTFGQEPPQTLRVKRRPYSIQFEMDDIDYETMCRSLGLQEGHTKTQGVCLNPQDVRKKVRETVGGSVILTRANYSPHIDEETKKQLGSVAFPIMDTEGTFYVPGAKGLKKFSVTWEREEDPVLDRHEEVHAFQNIILAAGYPYLNGDLEQSLFDEEQAQHLAETDNNVHRKRQLLLHTGYYAELNVPEGEFGNVAHKYYKPDRVPGMASRIIKQRDKNEIALKELQKTANAKLKYLVDWAMSSINFYEADRTLQIMPIVYQNL
ncbi:MAG: hypothetical protein HYT71_04220 [Candidatus Aenigmarchaeota archaeon]|nr:hypothetical protein [Candidatus Aenigmarchaeota archaeon]